MVSWLGSQLEPVVGSVEEVGGVGEPERVDLCDHVGDHVVDAHQRPPPVLEDVRDDHARLFREQIVGARGAMVSRSLLEGQVPVRWAWLMCWPVVLPVVDVPGRRVEGLVGRLVYIAPKVRSTRPWLRTLPRLQDSC
jgi:hypothetical protein